MTATNQKIISAILQKCEKYCPGAIDLLGVYGSAATGDTHPKSDLDLLIVCEGESTRIIADAFILDDLDVGYDIYCTPWSRLEYDAKCTHANLAKLLDSKIVWSKNDEALAKLKKLQNAALSRLQSNERYSCAASAFDIAKGYFADCILEESFSRCRAIAAACIASCLDALMLSKGKYFKLGVRRNFSELGFDEEQKNSVLNVICVKDANALKNALCALIRTVKTEITPSLHERKPVPGAYEEMYSNWKNKMSLAASENDVYSSFMNMAAFQYMLNGFSPADRTPDAMAGFDPSDLEASAESFDRALEEYRILCEEVGITPRRFANVDEFLSDYLK